MHIATGSRRSYSGLQKIFLDFCGAFEIEPLAITEDELCCAAAHYVLSHTVTTLGSYMSAVANLYLESGAQDDLPRGRKYMQFVQGVKRLLGAADEVVRTRALSLEQLGTILGALDQSDRAHVSFGAELSVAFFLALRTEDHTGGRLRWGDVYPQADGSVEFLIPPGKSVRRYRRVAIGRRGGVLDSLTWLKRLAALSTPSEREFNQPVFITVETSAAGGRRSRTTTRSAFIASFKSAVRNVLGFDPVLYAGYSLRRGGVTEMLLAGVPLPIIKQHVGWAPGSSAIDSYYDHHGRLQMRMPTERMGRR